MFMSSSLKLILVILVSFLVAALFWIILLIGDDFSSVLFLFVLQIVLLFSSVFVFSFIWLDEAVFSSGWLFSSLIVPLWDVVILSEEFGVLLGLPFVLSISFCG